MPTLFNTDSQARLVDPLRDERAVMPGESYDFTDEQVAAGIAGSWSEEDPRAGLPAEKEFKSRRDRKATAEADTTQPAEPEKE